MSRNINIGWKIDISVNHYYCFGCWKWRRDPLFVFFEAFVCFLCWFIFWLIWPAVLLCLVLPHLHEFLVLFILKTKIIWRFDSSMQIFEDSKALEEKLVNQGQHLDQRSENILGCLLDRLSSLASQLEIEDSAFPDIKVGVIMADRINKIRLAKKGL